MYARNPRKSFKAIDSTLSTLDAELRPSRERMNNGRVFVCSLFAEDGFLGLLVFSCSMLLGCSFAQAKHFYMCVTFSICLGSEIGPFRK